MNKNITILSLTLISTAIQASQDPDPTKFHYGYAAHEVYKASTTVKEVVMELPKVAQSTGANLAKGIWNELDQEKRKQLGKDIVAGALSSLSSEERQQIAYDFAKGTTEGIAAATAAGAVAAKKVVVAKTGAAVGAAMASPAAPFVLAGGFMAAGAFIVYDWEKNEREKTFSRCLNKHFDCTDVNEHGFSKRCDSPARKLYEVSPEKLQGNMSDFRRLKKAAMKPTGEFCIFHEKEERKS